MIPRHPQQRRSPGLRWWGMFFFCLSCVSWAQTPVPQTRAKSSPPTSGSLPVLSITSTDSPAQLVRKAEIAGQQAGGTLQAIALYQTAAQAFHKNGEIESEALAWHRIALLARKAGDARQAKAAAEKARTLLHVRTLPTQVAAQLSTAQSARAYLTLGRIHLESDEIKAAMEAYQNGLSAALKAKLPRETAAGYVALGRMAADADELDVALRMTGSSLDYWRAAKDFNGEAVALNNMARFYERKGELRLAADFDEQSIQVARFSRNYRGETAALNEAMRLHLLMGNHAAAAQACEQLIGLARLRGEKKNESDHTLALAVIDVQRNQLSSAYQLLLKALIIGAANDADLALQIRELTRKLESRPTVVNARREQLIAEAEGEAQRGAFGAAYQLLLRALLMNDGKSDASNVSLHAWIKSLASQIEARQRKTIATRP